MNSFRIGSSCISAFHAVAATGRKNLIMAGATTDVCLIFPAIDAAQEGFNVQAVMDASESPSDLSEEFSRQRMHDAGVVLPLQAFLPAGLLLRELPKLHHQFAFLDRFASAAEIQTTLDAYEDKWWSERQVNA